MIDFNGGAYFLIKCGDARLLVGRLPYRKSVWLYWDAPGVITAVAPFATEDRAAEFVEKFTGALA